MPSRNEQNEQLQYLADLLQGIKHLCDELRQLRFVPWPVDKEWQAAHKAIERAQGHNVASRKAIDACFEMLDHAKYLLPASWLMTDEGEPKLVQLRNGLRTMREYLKRHDAGARGYQMPMPDRHGSGPDAAPARDVKRWDESERIVRELGDELDDFLYAASASSAQEGDEEAGEGLAMPPAEQEAVPQRKGATPTTGAGGMTWEKARDRAEKHVNAHNGVFSNVKRIAEAVGCSRPTLEKAIKKSSYLKARQAEAKAKRSSRTVPLSDGAIDDESERRHNELNSLVAEQQKDKRREEQQAKNAKKRQS